MDARVQEFVVGQGRETLDEAIERLEPGDVLVTVKDGEIVSRLRRVGRKTTREERERSLDEFRKWRRAHGPTLGPDLTIKDLIEEGRR